MDSFKKAMAVSAAVATFAVGAYTGLQGLKSMLADQIADHLAVREEVIAVSSSTSTKK